MPSVLTLTPLALSLPQRVHLHHLSCLCYPREACGLLLGRHETSRTAVTHVLEARNLADSNERFDLDPADHLAAERLAHSSALEVIGIWHSHPDQPARPSAADLRHAWHAWSYVIVSVTAGELRSWRLVGARFVEEPLSP